MCILGSFIFLLLFSIWLFGFFPYQPNTWLKSELWFGKMVHGNSCSNYVKWMNEEKILLFPAKKFSGFDLDFWRRPGAMMSLQYNADNVAKFLQRPKVSLNQESTVIIPNTYIKTIFTYVIYMSIVNGKDNHLLHLSTQYSIKIENCLKFVLATFFNLL